MLSYTNSTLHELLVWTATNMKIKSIDLFTYDVPVAEPLQFGGELEASVPGVLARISTDEGTEGVGETTLHPNYYYGENQKSVLGCIEYLRPELLDRDPSNIRAIEQVTNKIAGNLIPKTIISFAIFDIIGKKLNAPVCVLLGGRLRDSVPLIGMVGGGSAQQSVDRSRKLVADRFSTLKLTRGIDRNKEVDRLKAVRDAVGSQVKIRFDVNAAWTPKFAIRTIRNMERYEVEFVEQPVPGWDIDGLARVAKSVGPVQ
jgi:L-alanine-DL-glutamate epimerase-like enolase superfamily enzyme